MNQTVKECLEKLNIDPQKIEALEESKIKSGVDVNHIIEWRGFFNLKHEPRTVSIADVVGYDYAWHQLPNESIVENMSHFFDATSGDYGKRSISMLEIPEDEIMSKLNSSFNSEPIHLNEVDENTYVVGDNGLHRFHVLKMHYLNELSKLNPQDEIGRKKLREKYTFKANVTTVDFFKTYTYYILNLLDDKCIARMDESDLDKIQVTIFSSNPIEQMSLSQDQFFELMQEKLTKFLQSGNSSEVDEIKETLQSSCKKFDSFKKYYNEFLGPIIKRGEEDGNNSKRI